MGKHIRKARMKNLPIADTRRLEKQPGWLYKQWEETSIWKGIGSGVIICSYTTLFSILALLIYLNWFYKPATWELTQQWEQAEQVQVEKEFGYKVSTDCEYNQHQMECKSTFNLHNIDVTSIKDKCYFPPDTDIVIHTRSKFRDYYY